MKSIIPLIIFFSWFVFGLAQSDCKLSELKIKPLACDSNDYFKAELDFKHEGPGDCFRIKGNGHDYGEFKYSLLPIALDSFKGDCKSSYEFVIQDCHFQDCKIVGELAKVCCDSVECSIKDLQVEKTACNDDQKFFVFFKFNHQGPGDCFRIRGNGHDYGEFKYSQLPVKIGPLAGDCTTNYEFVIIDCHKEDCRLEYNLGKVCCESTDCKLSELQVEKTACNDDQKFFVFFKFNHQGQGDCFRIRGNGHDYGEFKYSQLPVKIGPLAGDCTTNYEFVIIDCHKENCRLEYNLGKVCCESSDCKLSELQVEKTVCNDDQKFFVFFKFNHQGQGDCFRIRGNGHDYGEFKYSQLPVKIGPLAGDCTTNYEFVIIDCHKEDCRLEYNLGKVCCESSDCKLSELQVEKTACNDDQKFFVFFKFNHQGPGDCFRIRGNGHDYGEFKYSQLPVKIGPLAGDCTTNYEFVIIDCHKEDCRLEYNLGKVCCESSDCKLSELQVEKTACNDDQKFFVFFKFNHQGSGDCFRIRGNGHDYGEFKYSQLPVKIGPLAGDCTTNYEFVIIDCHKEDCRLEYNLGKVCCESSDCKLSELQVEKTACNDDQKFFVFFKFNHQGPGDCFRIRGNGHDYGEFKYSQLPVKIGPLAGDCTTNYEFVIIDCHKEDCRLEYNLGKVCCESSDCKLSELQVEKTACNDDQKFFVFFKFNHQGSGDCFRIRGNGHDYEEFKYSQLPVKIGPLAGDCTTNYEFVIIDCHKEDCRLEYNLGKVCCESTDCKLSELQVEKTACNDDQKFFVFFKFNHQGPGDCFRIRGNGHDYGEFKYSQLPVKIGPLAGDCTTNYEFVIIDCHKEDCRLEYNLGKVCCDSNACKLSDLKIEKSDCNDLQKVDLFFNFKYSNTSDSFTLRGNGVQYGTFSYNKLPIKLENIVADCHKEYEFVITDQKKENCKLVIELGKICCEKDSVECKIYDIEAVVLDCNSPDDYNLKINFKYQGFTNSGFDIFDRNGLIAYRLLKDLPVVINHVKKSGKDYELIKICENDHPTCCKAIEYKSPDCITNGGKYAFGSEDVFQNGEDIIIRSKLAWPEGLEFRLFDITGQLLVTHYPKGGVNISKVSCANMTPGAYIVKLNYNNHHLNKKIFIYN